MRKPWAVRSRGYSVGLTMEKRTCCFVSRCTVGDLSHARHLVVHSSRHRLRQRASSQWYHFQSTRRRKRWLCQTARSRDGQQQKVGSEVISVVVAVASGIRMLGRNWRQCQSYLSSEVCSFQSNPGPNVCEGCTDACCCTATSDRTWCWIAQHLSVNRWSQQTTAVIIDERFCLNGIIEEKTRRMATNTSS